jgi:hypothetical protein
MIDKQKKDIHFYLLSGKVRASSLASLIHFSTFLALEFMLPPNIY